MEKRPYTIDQICECSGFSRRTVRYYIQEGLLDPPAGRGRGGYYYDSHLQQLQRIHTLQESGLSLSDIQHMLKGGIEPGPAPPREVWIRYPVLPGVEIHVSRDLEERERRKLTKIVRVARRILKGENEDD